MGSRYNEDDAVLDRLEQKINKLEKLIKPSKADDKSASLIDSLLAANNMLTAAANRGKNIQAINKRLPELHRNLSDGLVGNPTSEFDRQLNLVLSLSGQYQSNVQVLQKVASLHESLDAGNMKSLDELQPQLAEVLDEYRTLHRMFEDAENVDKLDSKWVNIQAEIIKELAAAHKVVSQLEADCAKK